MMSTRCRAALACAALVLLNGCGGGGSADAETAPSGPEVPLAITAASGPQAMALTLGLAESALMLGHAAREEVAEARRTMPAGTARPCPSGGLREGTLDDRDASGGVTAGDVLRLRYTNCWLPWVVGVASGDLVIEVETSARSDGVAGRVSFGSGLRLSEPGATADIIVGGEFRFDAYAARLDSAMRVSAVDRAALVVGQRAGRTTVEERLRRFDIRKALDLRTARYEWRAEVQHASGTLGGLVEVTTEEALTGWAGAVPDTGRVRLIGARDTSAELRAQGLPARIIATVLVDADGNGTADATDQLDWTTALAGYVFWAEGAAPPNLWTTNVYPSFGVQLPDFRLIQDASAPPVRLPLQPSIT